jgi:hypothetical protein
MKTLKISDFSKSELLNSFFIVRGANPLNHEKVLKIKINDITEYTVSYSILDSEFLNPYRVLIENFNYEYNIIEIYSKINIYVERLLKEWQTHGKIILAIDFDSTISYWNSIENQEDIERALNLIHRAQFAGCYVVIHTACKPDREEEILKHCQKLGIRVDAINLNPIYLPYGKDESNLFSKIFYNHQLCDRSGFREAMDILEEATNKFIGWKVTQEHKQLDDVA